MIFKKGETKRFNLKTVRARKTGRSEKWYGGTANKMKNNLQFEKESDHGKISQKRKRSSGPDSARLVNRGNAEGIWSSSRTLGGFLRSFVARWFSAPVVRACRR